MAIIEASVLLLFVCEVLGLFLLTPLSVSKVRSALAETPRDRFLLRECLLGES